MARLRMVRRHDRAHFPSSSWPHPGDPAQSAIPAPRGIGPSSPDRWVVDGQSPHAKAYAATIHTAAVMIVVDGVASTSGADTAKRFHVHSSARAPERAVRHPCDGRTHPPHRYARRSRHRRQRAAPLADREAGDRRRPPQIAITSSTTPRSTRREHGDGAARARELPSGTFWYYNNWDFKRPRDDPRTGTRRRSTRTSSADRRCRRHGRLPSRGRLPRARPGLDQRRVPIPDDGTGHGALRPPLPQKWPVARAQGGAGRLGRHESTRSYSTTARAADTATCGGVLGRPAPHVGLLQRRGVLGPGGRPPHSGVPYLNMVVVTA